MDKFETYEVIYEMLSDFDMDSAYAILCNLNAAFIMNLRQITNKNSQELMSIFAEEISKVIEVKDEAGKSN